MAEQAQKEPTMEEILSSIRKIIADDDAPVAGAAATETITEEELDVFDDLDLATGGETAEMPESEEDVLAAISQSMEEVSLELEAEAEVEAQPEPPVAEETFEFAVEEDSFENFAEDDFEGVEDFAEVEAVEDAFEPVAEEPAVFEVEPEVEFTPEPQPEPVMAEPVMKEEVTMSAKAAPLADAATVGAAAGALGKLLSKVEFGEEAGSANTIEGLVREMLRPMLKEWLDDNLPGIVEKHVEAEVQRIARMAG